METYFFDDRTGLLIAFDEVAGTFYRLKQIGLAGAGPEVAPALPKLARKQTLSSGCPECGSPSRHKANCSRPSRDNFPRCSECKKIGRHARWCSGYERVQKAAKIKSEIDEFHGRSGAMPKEKFDQVKLATSHEIPPDSIARELNLSTAEVDRAIIAATYEAYQR